MPAEKIGAATCPLCKGTAAVSLAKSQLVVLTCNACNIQLFCRSDKSDSLVRALLKKDKAPAPATDAPAAQPEPVQTTPAPKQPIPVRTGPRIGFF